MLSRRVCNAKLMKDVAYLAKLFEAATLMDIIRQTCYFLLNTSLNVLSVMQIFMDFVEA